ncbi:uncharacterized protein LOC133036050 [Cannabis sativa]|uniref:uncharacterized protein LOC133036050 n=1 Tax=Cannabis sativa TaxID=3483 RepID=UPI0029CA105E|nr:uncharacterized protein LOC133036050 [Cannabis sativa]
MRCVTSVKFSVLLNGAPLKAFCPGRGLRQGDPLSPYLFILCSEVLSKLVCRAETKGEITGIKIGKNSMPLSHTFYADDALFFCKATHAESQNLLRCLETYEHWSGQKISKAKSSVFFSPKVGQEARQELKDCLGISTLMHKEKYLGNPLLVSIKKREDFSFLKAKVLNRLEGWKAKCLSHAGRLTLAQSVLRSIPCYAMSTFRIPRSICKDLDSIMARFWWKGNHGDSSNNHYLALKSWSAICQPKRNGGLGLRRFRDMNLALLAKLAWSLLCNINRPWVKILLAKYCGSCSFWEVEKQGSDSFLWKGIIETRRICVEGAGIIIGNGKTELWTKPWIPGFTPEEIRQSFSFVPNHKFTIVADLFLPGTRLWNADLIQACFQPAIPDAILRIKPLPLEEDVVFWKASNKGVFSVKSAYWLSQQHRFHHEKECWKKLWKLKTHPRHALLMWKTMSGCLPLKANLGFLQAHDRMCALCNTTLESEVHLFWECSFARALWFQSPWSFHTAALQFDNFEQLFTWFGSFDDHNLLFHSACVMEEIWLSRNDMTFHNSSPDLNASHHRIMRRFSEFYHVKECESISDTQFSEECLSNFDAIFMTDASVVDQWAGLAFVQIGNAAESFHGQDYCQVISVLHAELEAILLALKAASVKKFSKIQILSDNATAIQALKVRELPFAWGSFPVFRQCVEMFKFFSCISFKSVSRADNSVADRLAYLARVNNVRSLLFVREAVPLVTAS